jgi:uncharacterized protein (DUF2164 family)
MKQKEAASVLDKEQATAALMVLRQLFEERFDVKLGLFEAKEILDYLYIHIGKFYYNQALKDMQELIHKRFESIDADLWILEK